MMIFRLLRAYNQAEKISHFSREEILKLRENRLKETLLHAYDHCPYYREIWSAAGINRDNLLETPLEKFPTVTKKQIMENFEGIVTEKTSLSKVEKFMFLGRIWGSLFKRKYIVLNTSGSSGYIGVFLFTKEFWSRQLGTVAARIIGIPFWEIIFNRTKIAFTGQAVGPQASSRIVRSAPSFLLRVWSMKISTPLSQLIKSLNRFQPDMLSGYASTLATAASLQIKGELRIYPKIVISSSEPLTPIRRETIRKAFGVEPINWYTATECLALAVQSKEKETMDVFDDIVSMQTIDKDGNPLPDGQHGKIVITVFGNKIQPLVRYVLDDEATVYPEAPGQTFTQMSIVNGRSMDEITIALDSGQTVIIHQMELIGFFVPGLVQYQIIQTSPKSLVLKVVLDGGNRERILRQIKWLVRFYLKKKAIPEKAVDVKVEVVDSIPPDPKTNKTPIVIPFKQ